MDDEDEDVDEEEDDDTYPITPAIRYDNTAIGVCFRACKTVWTCTKRSCAETTGFVAYPAAGFFVLPVVFIVVVVVPNSRSPGIRATIAPILFPILCPGNKIPPCKWTGIIKFRDGKAKTDDEDDDADAASCGFTAR